MRLTLPISTYRRDGGALTRVLNCYPEKGADKGPILCRPAPGVADFVTIPGGDCRGACFWRDDLYAVYGSTLYRIGETGSVMAIGSIPGTDRVSLQPTRVGISIAAGSLYAWDGTTLTAVTDPDAPTTSHLAYLDGFVLFLGADDRFGAFDLASITSVDGLAFATAESAPDDLVGIAVDRGQIILGGERTTELYWNAGAAGFPFERIPDGTLEIGLAAPWSYAQADNSVLWLADDRTFRGLRDRVAVRVSQHGVEAALRRYARVDDCEAYSYRLEGHECVVWNFPSAGATWVYDATAGEFHERETQGQSGWQVRGIVRAWGGRFYAFAAGKVGELSATTWDEWGAAIRREWWYPPVYAQRSVASHRRFESAAQPGQGLPSGQGSDPQIGLDYSDDLGATWKSLPTRSLGRQGVRTARQVWTNLGSSRDRVYRQWVSDPVPVVVHDAVAEVDGGYL
jgi:hypothetical protein